MTDYVNYLHTAVFTDPTGCGKCFHVLDLIEKECKKHSYYIIIFCPML